MGAKERHDTIIRSRGLGKVLFSYSEEMRRKGGNALGHYGCADGFNWKQLNTTLNKIAMRMGKKPSRTRRNNLEQRAGRSTSGDYSIIRLRRGGVKEGMTESRA